MKLYAWGKVLERARATVLRAIGELPFIVGEDAFYGRLEGTNDESRSLEKLGKMRFGLPYNLRSAFLVARTLNAWLASRPYRSLEEICLGDRDLLLLCDGHIARCEKRVSMTPVRR